ncbi:hypothetical protein C8R45DRAFT_964255 [Mycena sanguinolenta]|nr:hypothetical protein C8R45DRAFT_964255 [Mycena sanguinolenta]
MPAVVWQHGGQLKELEILHEEDSDSDEEESGPGLLPNFLDLLGDEAPPPKPLPLLETLTVRSEVEHRGFLAPQIMYLLCLASNLVNYTCSDNHLFAFSVPAEKRILPTLRTLTFGSRNKPQRDGGILSCVLFPALTDLSMGMGSSGRCIFRFLKDSTPALQSLGLGMLAYDTPDCAELHECLYLIPSLARLEMWYPSSRHLAHFLSTLANSPSMLPILRTFIIHPHSISDSSWEALLRVLLARRIELHIDGKRVSRPPQDVLAAMAELVARGAKIRIRSPRRDYI